MYCCYPQVMIEIIFQQRNVAVSMLLSLMFNFRMFNLYKLLICQQLFPYIVLCVLVTRHHISCHIEQMIKLFLRHNHEPLGKYEMLCHLEYLHVHYLSILNRKVSLFVHIFFSFYVSLTLTNMGNRNLHQIQLLLLPVLKRDLKTLWLLYILRNQHFFPKLAFLQ